MRNKLRQIYRILFPKTKEQPASIYTKDIFKDKTYVIGDYTYGKPSVLFDNQGANLVIGKFCSIAANVTIFLGGNHRTDWITTYPFNVLHQDFPSAKEIIGHPVTKGDVVIGNDVWIGNGVTIMSGVKIGNGAVIGAGAIVSKNIGAYEIWAGNPAKFVKKRFSDADILFLESLKWWDKDLTFIQQNVRELCSENINSLKKIK